MRPLDNAMLSHPQSILHNLSDHVSKIATRLDRFRQPIYVR